MKREGRIRWHDRIVIALDFQHGDPGIYDLGSLPGFRVSVRSGKNSASTETLGGPAGNHNL